MIPRSSSAYLLPTLFLFSLIHGTQATPVSSAAMFAKRDPIIVYNDSGQILNVTDPSSGFPIPQGDATDGSGSDFSVSAILWLAYCFAIGVPLMLAGIRLWRVTTGFGVGIAATVCVWAAFVNAMNAEGISDLLITVIPLGAFVCGFAVGCFNFCRIPGIACLCILGGISVGVRIVLFRPGLLIPDFGVNWIIIVVFAVINFALLFLSQRTAIAIASTSTGTFLTALGIDLLLNRQSGMSLGLRYLLDRNSSHIIYLRSRGWHPSMTTEILMAVSLALIPVFTIAQHFIFRAPFNRRRHDDTLLRSSIDSETQYEDGNSSAALVPASEKKALEQSSAQEVALLSTTPTSAAFGPPDTPSSAGNTDGKSVGYAV